MLCVRACARLQQQQQPSPHHLHTVSQSVASDGGTDSWRRRRTHEWKPIGGGGGRATTYRRCVTPADGATMHARIYKSTQKKMQALADGHALNTPSQEEIEGHLGADPPTLSSLSPSPPYTNTNPPSSLLPQSMTDVFGGLHGPLSQRRAENIHSTG